MSNADAYLLGPFREPPPYPACSTAPANLFTGSIGRVTDGTESAASSFRLQTSRFISQFELEYGSRRPPFLECTYAQAVATAREELRCLLVILISEEHDDTPEFCRRLVDEDFRSFLERRNLMVWGGNVKYQQAYEVSTTLQASKYPFLAVVTPKYRSGSLRMAVAERIEGLLPVDQMLSQIEVKVQASDDALAAVRRSREEREAARRLREQQDQAYLDSLRADQEKERKLREKREAEALRQRRKDERVLQEEDIYNFVDTRNLREAGASSDSDLANAESATTLPADYQQTYKFRLVSPMPRQVFEPSNAPICEAFQAVWPSTSLIIEEIEDDSSDEE
ncbi:Ubx domain-containing protein [Tieghemiomyces parasiticus]|uniref:Ubx domain-containing protein n=1 Tax=Tieghemiomyces parasiticus TaxID=78921 RepID=A0A9W8ADW3_9FUNG|nr:Ubx domain-containing protein [Tieghemiomyces parasiticus]